MELITGLLYNIGIRSYSLLVGAASFFVPKARLWTEGRKHWREKLRKGVQGAEKVAWFHAASLGEFEQGRPVIEAFRQRHPEYFILLTFYSPSGYEIRKNYTGADFICYLPSDTPANALDFVEIVRPDITFFIKYEFWHNYLTALKKSGSVVISFAAIFRPGQLFFRKGGGFYRNLLTRFDAILVQDERSVELLRQCENLGEVQIAGDTRFDRVAELEKTARKLTEIEEFVKGEPCLVVGSAWAEDMQILIPVLNRLEGRLKAIIAPHEIREAEITAWENQLNQPSLRYSRYKKEGFRLSNSDTRYLFIDNIGMLSALYRYGQIAYIGGSFGKGLHNTLEAATYGMPVLFGNRSYQKFSEAVRLLDRGVARTVAGEDELYQAIRGYLDHPEELRRVSAMARDFVQANTGATEKVMEAAERLLELRKL